MSAIPTPFKGSSFINRSPIKSFDKLVLEDDCQIKPPTTSTSSQTTPNQPFLGLPTPKPTTNVDDMLKSLLVVMHEMKEEMTRNTNAVLSKVIVNSETITQIQIDNVVRNNKITDLQNQLNLLKEDKTTKVATVNSVNNKNQQHQNQNQTNHQINCQMSNDTISKEREAANGMVWNMDKSLTTEGQIMEEGRKWLGLVPLDKSYKEIFIQQYHQ